MEKIKLKLIIATALMFLFLIVLVTILILTNKGSLEIITDPSQAKIILDGKEKGEAPLTIKGISPGKHQLEIKKDGYTSVKKDVTIKRGKQKVEERLERGLAPAIKNLPRNTNHYVIEYSIPDPKNYTDITYKITLKATLNKITPETWAKYEKALKEYKTEALKWLEENEVNVSTAKIEWLPKKAKDL